VNRLGQAYNFDPTIHSPLENGICNGICDETHLPDTVRQGTVTQDVVTHHGHTVSDVGRGTADDTVCPLAGCGR